MENFIEENAVKNRLFYIIIPSEKNGFRSKKDQRLNQLNIRIKLCQEKLSNCNLVTKRLGTNELVSLLSTYFEGFVECGNEYQSALTLLERSGNVVPKVNAVTKRAEEPCSA